MQGRRGVVWDTEISLKYTTTERPIQTDVPCFRRNLAFRPGQTRMLNELKGDYRYNCAPLNEEVQFPWLESLSPFSRELRMLGFWVWAQLSCMDLGYCTVKDQFAHISVNAVFCMCICRLTAGKLRDFWLPPRYEWDRHSAGVLRSVDWWLFSDVSGQPTAPHSALTLEVYADRLCRNVDSWLQINVVWNHRRAKISVEE
jgi:hypothetical protein